MYMIEKKVLSFVYVVALLLGLGWYAVSLAGAVYDRSPRVKVGQKLDVPGAKGHRVLLLEVRPTCVHCINNEWVYKRIANQAKVKSGEIRVVYAMQGVETAEGR